MHAKSVGSNRGVPTLKVRGLIEGSYAKGVGHESNQGVLMPNSTDHIFILSSSSANMPALSVRILLTLPRISLSVSSDRIGLSWALFAERMVERKSRSISFSPFTYLEVAEERERERQREKNGK